MKPIVVFYINTGSNDQRMVRQILGQVNLLIPDEFRREYWVFILPVQYQETKVELLHAKGTEELDLQKLDEEVKNMINNYKNG